MKKKIFSLLLLLAILLPNSAYANSEQTDFKSKILNEALEVSEIFVKHTSTSNEKKENKVVNYVGSKNIHANARPVPILMFHEVGYVEKKEYSDANYILKDNINRKFQYLIDNGYTTITMNDLYENWVNGKELPEKPVVLTFDDGYASHFTHVKNMFKRLNIKGTFFIVQDRLFMGIRNRNIDGVKELFENGMEIGVHTFSHPDFTNLGYDEIYKEVSTCKNYLEGELGVNLSTFSYPYGNYNDAALKVLRDLGFKTAVTTKEGLARPNQFETDNELRISRYNVFNSTTDEEFKLMLDGLK